MIKSIVWLEAIETKQTKQLDNVSQCHNAQLLNPAVVLSVVVVVQLEEPYN